jgi:YfiH family protein
LNQAKTRFLQPDWPVAERVNACVTTRGGGVSQSPYNSFNLATHVGDDPDAVLQNRALLKQWLKLPEAPRWLDQVHGTAVADESCIENCQADACFTRQKGRVCAVLTADCLPVFIASRNGSEVGVAHAGWKGLLNGVIEQTAACFSTAPDELCVWLGPAIGAQQFEVGDEVRQAFLDKALANKATVAAAFAKHENQKWLADIYALARHRLLQLGISQITGGNFCTVSNEQMFYSYRRDGITGRMASLIWISD